MKAFRFLFLVFVFLALWANPALAVEAPPLARVIKTSPGQVFAGKTIQLPCITWGGDLATILANGNSTTTLPGSIFAEQGLSFSIQREDDFKKQLENYISGKTPFLRGTMGMINMAADLLDKNPSTRPVVIYQLTWSNGGDCLVVKPGIDTAKDLKGKTIALQAYGPHVDYMATILKDAGLSVNDVNIRWTRDLTGTDHTPAEAFYEPGVDAAFAIIPDGLLLTSNGTVGTGAEGSVKGARILLSTKTASRVISDVYAVRSDFFQQNRDLVRKFVHGLLLGQQELRNLYKNSSSQATEFKAMLTAGAKILLDSPQATADAQALYGDCEFVGFRGNTRFFGDQNWPRNFQRLTGEIQNSFLAMGLLTARAPLAQAQWDYNLLRAGLTGISDVPAPRFKAEEVARVVSKKQAMGTLAEGELFSFEINFQPNQKDFPETLYADQFSKVVNLAATYGGAVITVEGHSDPQKFNKLTKQGADQIVLTRTRQAAKNLSINRALAVRDAVTGFAAKKSVPLDASQFTVVGHGINAPKFARPKTKEQWLSNMRVTFRIIQIEAEESVFEPL